MGALFAWIENTSIATTVAGSAALTATLSAVHLLGFTLVTSGALVANLRSLGLLFRQRQDVELVVPANRVVLLGLAISVSTGALLFSPRATAAGTNGIFELKMLLLLGAALFHFAAYRHHTARAYPRRAVGAIGLTLWLTLAATACAFILLE
jgi:hypothetical protein